MVRHAENIFLFRYRFTVLVELGVSDFFDDDGRFVAFIVDEKIADGFVCGWKDRDWVGRVPESDFPAGEFAF